MRGITKKQHYVPRFYLKNFAIKKKSGEYLINCFNKENGKTFKENIMQVAMEKYFYDKNDPPEIENFLAKIEGYHANVYNKIVNKKSIESLTRYEQAIMSHYILIQNERTRSARVRDSQIAMLVYKDLETKQNFPPWEDFNDEYKKWLFESRGAMGQINIMFYPVEDEEGNLHYPIEVIKSLLDLDWTLAVNDIKMEFYTSDHPIFVNNPVSDRKVIIKGYGAQSYQAKGVEIYFPLTPRLCLILYDREFSPYRNSGLKRWINKDELEWINTQIIAEAHRIVFTRSNDFRFVRKCIEKYPELKDPNRNRIYV